MQGHIEESTVREAVSRLFLVRMKLGEFDPPEMNPYKKYVLYHRTDCNEYHKQLRPQAPSSFNITLK